LHLGRPEAQEGIYNGRNRDNGRGTHRDTPATIRFE
jgi:hypothetical protein